ncbi:hypothetical protein FO519_003144 [Halicephalobus sp. NKZ332]|nr:hypothetical protein FO519_003144 [Halicephalobus sp. NKZ332]
MNSQIFIMTIEYSVDIFLWIFETFLGAIHVLMIFFLITKRRKKVQIYRSPFYAIFIWISIFDLVYVVNNDIGAKMAKYPALMPFFLSETYYPTAFYFISAYSSAFEISGHTILSINRYWVIKNAKINQVCWSKKVTWVFYSLMFIFPIPTTVYRLFTPAQYHYNNGIPSITYVDPIVSQIVSYANMSYYTVNVIPSLFATVCSFINYQHLKKLQYEVTANEKHELKLIIHTSLMFLLLAARYIYQIALLIATYTKSTSVTTVAQFFFPIIASSYSLFGSSMLLIISKQVRYDFFNFYRRKSENFQDISHATEEMAEPVQLANAGCTLFLIFLLIVNIILAGLAIDFSSWTKDKMKIVGPLYRISPMGSG